jgi:hypothetical protein
MNGPKVNFVALVKLNYMLEYSLKGKLLVQKRKASLSVWFLPYERKQQKTKF